MDNSSNNSQEQVACWQREMLEELSDSLGRDPVDDPVSIDGVAGVFHNLGPTTLVTSLFAFLDDIKAFVLEPVLRGQFDVYGRYGIHPEPLFNINAPNVPCYAFVQSIFEREHHQVQKSLELLLRALHKILQQRTLGASTAGKMAFVKSITGHALTELSSSELSNCIVELRQRTLMLLSRQDRRLPSEHAKRSDVRSMVDRILRDVSNEDVAFYRLRALAENQLGRVVALDQFLQVYFDEIAQLVHDQFGCWPLPGNNDIRVRTGKGLEIAFARRDRDYLTLGDAYGDCTAMKARNQAEARTTNIHSTVYTWILDPFYQIAEVYVDGERVIKAHLVPLVINEQTVLSLDAIEVVPILRYTIAGQPNRYLSSRLYRRRRDLLEFLFDAVLDLGHRMDVELILVDRFSNADWIRAELAHLQTTYYEARDVEKVFGWSVVRNRLTQYASLPETEIVGEVQAANTQLMDQGLQWGFKEAAVLSGVPRSVAAGVFRGP